MLQFDEYKVRLNNLAPVLEELGQALDLESAEGVNGVRNGRSSGPGQSGTAGISMRMP